MKKWRMINESGQDGNWMAIGWQLGCNWMPMIATIAMMARISQRYTGCTSEANLRRNAYLLHLTGAHSERECCASALQELAYEHNMCRQCWPKCNASPDCRI